MGMHASAPPGNGTSGAASDLLVPVASRVDGYAVTGLLGSASAGGLKGGTARFRHTCLAGFGEVQIAFGNWYTLSGKETLTPNDITVKASIEYPSGTFHSVYFHGARSVTLEPGAVVWSDPLALDVPKGEFFYSRVTVTVADADQWPASLTTKGTWGEGSDYDIAPTDKTDSGTVTTKNSAAYGPCAIKGKVWGSLGASVAILGDSISIGYDDTSPERIGFLRRILNDQYPMQMVGQGSDAASHWNDTNRANWAARRATLLGGCNVAITHHGTNDLGNNDDVATMKANLTTLWTLLARRGMEVHACTFPPRTTSTDSWATTGNQTVTGNEARRVEMNDWIRTIPAPLSGYIETADVLETARNSGLFKVNGSANYYTDDGIHPSATAHADLVTAIGADVLAAVGPQTADPL